MAVSETDVINAALRLVAAQRITGRAQGNKNSNVADDLYPIVRDTLLRAHSWNFATLRAKLAQDGAAPAFEFDHAYAVPSDWIRTISVHDNDAGTGTVRYKEENQGGKRYLLASVEDLYLRYVSKVTDVNLFAADFVAALVTALARDLSLPIANSNTMHARFEQRARRDLTRAKSSDSLGQSPEPLPRGPWANSRGGFGSRQVWPR